MIYWIILGGLIVLCLLLIRQLSKNTDKIIELENDKDRLTNQVSYFRDLAKTLKATVEFHEKKRKVKP